MQKKAEEPEPEQELQEKAAETNIPPKNRNCKKNNKITDVCVHTINQKRSKRSKNLKLTITRKKTRGEGRRGGTEEEREQKKTEG